MTRRVVRALGCHFQWQWAWGYSALGPDPIVNPVEVRRVAWQREMRWTHRDWWRERGKRLDV